MNICTIHTHTFLKSFIMLVMFLRQLEVMQCDVVMLILPEAKDLHKSLFHFFMNTIIRTLWVWILGLV